MEQNFLNQFFGSNAVTHAFARELIEAGRKDVLRELNKSVKILGSGSGVRIVDSLREKFNIPTHEQRRKHNQTRQQAGEKVAQSINESESPWLLLLIIIFGLVTLPFFIISLLETVTR